MYQVSTQKKNVSANKMTIAYFEKQPTNCDGNIKEHPLLSQSNGKFFRRDFVGQKAQVEQIFVLDQM